MTTPVVVPYAEETLIAYEFGSKNRFLGNKLQVNAAFYYYDYGGYQASLLLDPANPQVASRMTTAFKSWRMLEPVRRGRAEAALRRIAGTPTLSRDVGDIVLRTLADT